MPWKRMALRPSASCRHGSPRFGTEAVHDATQDVHPGAQTVAPGLRFAAPTRHSNHLEGFQT